MIDLLYLSWNRREFTEASLKALRENTDWDLVNSLCIIDDHSDRDGLLNRLWPVTSAYLKPREHLGSPVSVMRWYLSMNYENMGPAPIFCKLDNDVIVPPGWLNESLAVMEAHPEVDLLGIEPGVGPNPKATRGVALWRNAQPMEYDPTPRDIVPCDFIGGIGLMRRRIFNGRYGLPEPLNSSGEPGAGRHGFTEWQERNPGIKKAWIAPGLPVILLNRMPMEPWASLSREYVAKGWQRDWPGPYKPEEKATWEWWIP